MLTKSIARNIFRPLILVAVSLFFSGGLTNSAWAQGNTGAMQISQQIHDNNQMQSMVQRQIYQAQDTQATIRNMQNSGWNNNNNGNAAAAGQGFVAAAPDVPVWIAENRKWTVQERAQYYSQQRKMRLAMRYGADSPWAR